MVVLDDPWQAMLDFKLRGRLLEVRGPVAELGERPGLCLPLTEAIAREWCLAFLEREEIAEALQEAESLRQELTAERRGMRALGCAFMLLCEGSSCLMTVKLNTTE